MPRRVRLSIAGMTCQNCVRHVREALLAVPGVRSVDVELTRGVASILVLDSAGLDAAALAGAVRNAGYEARGMNAGLGTDGEFDSRPTTAWDKPLALGVVVTLLLMLGEWGAQLGHAVWFRWSSFALGTLVQVFSGKEFYRGAWRQLRRRQSSMDTLVALGSTTAYLLSVTTLVSGSHAHLQFLEAAGIITFISLGHWIEARVSRRSEAALHGLLRLAPEEARRQEPDGQERLVPVAKLKLNDAVVLRPGDAVPTDGTVIEGDSAVDESLLTVESMPVEKTLHSRLYAGTTNLNGRLVVLVTGTGAQTALAAIIEAVKRAQTSRANIQRLADRVSNVFVPVVVLCAVATGLLWGLAPHAMGSLHAAVAGWFWHMPAPASPWVAALLNMAAVLIVACPCAMGLATPAAIMVAANTAARRGILIRDGVALEKAGVIDTVVFDKTGTLTMGKPRLMRFEAYVNAGEGPALDEMRIAVSLASRSNHPISRAIAAYQCEPYVIENWREIHGRGIEARIMTASGPAGGRTLRLGSLRWLQELEIELARAGQFIDQWSSRGATLVGVAVDSAMVGLLAVRDDLKPGAAGVVADLASTGCEVHIVTGDRAASAQAIAAEVGLAPNRVRFEADPEQKPEYVRQLQRQGRRVAFVGDGLNDAPALEQADLGIAVSQAADISRKAADMLLLRSDIAVIPEALGLARVTLRRIRQNLFWAFFYNAAAIPLAALGFLSPLLCAVLMGVSDLVVIGNSLTLYWWKPFRRKRLLAAFNSGIGDPTET